MRRTLNPSRNLLEAIGELYQHSNLQQFPRIVLRTLRILVPQDSAGYNEVDFVAGRITAELDSPTYNAEEITTALVPYMHVHPLIRYFNQTGDGTAHRITDFVTQKQFEASELYQVVYKSIGVRRQMSLGIQTPELVLIGAVSNRSGRDFSERDRKVLNHLRPHLVQAYQNARAVTRLQHSHAQLDRIARSKGFGVVITDSGGRIDSLIGAAANLLAEYFSPPPSPTKLPDDLQRWMTASLALSAKGLPHSPLAVQRHGGQLSARLLPAVAGPYHTIVLDPAVVPLATGPLLAAGFTHREIDVLRLIADGKSNEEIAAALTIRPRTVQKHLEHVFEKFKVQSRGAAAAKARSLMPGERSSELTSD